MYNLSNQLLEQYPFEVSDVQKGRGAYICTTTEGKIILKEFKGSPAKAKTLEEILNTLSSSSIRADEIVHTAEGEILAKETDETVYYARRCIEGRECETKNRDDILLAVKEMARLHNVLHTTNIECQAVPKKAFLEEVKKHNREIRKVRNYIHGKHKKNEFELMFMNHYEGFLRQALAVETELNEWLMTACEEEINAMYGICHGDYNQHNVLFTGNEIALTNFEQSSFDMQIVDLTHFLRKLMEKHNFNVRLASDMICAYEQERRLSPGEWKQLYLRMAYPEKFWKVANHYFNANKAWVSMRDIEKLKKVIEQEEIRQEFLRILFYFVR